MFSDLPAELQKKVEKYLLTDNFRAAKAIHDAWLDELKKCATQTGPQQLTIAEAVSS
ncbi:MAG: hypothetical protein K0U29_01590 [Gammaproteobacteria bacterium]|nr:hypothetical protein [Gammaproteobacteria bacterium]MCH9743601.1 hypothetical protein [Gammaproteobacteria bacterium]